MNVVNVLFGAYIEKGGVNIADKAAEMMRAELEAVGIRVGLLDCVPTKDDVEAGINSNKYDVVVCQEALSGASIGGGSIRQWSSINAKLKIILIIDKKKKGAKKLKSLYNENFYYDALYGTDLTGANVAELIKASRTMEEAAEYYGLQKQEEEEVTAKQPEKNDNEGSSPVNNEVKQIDEAEPVKESAEVMPTMEASKEQELDGKTMDQKFDETLRSMEDLFNDSNATEPEKDSDNNDEYANKNQEDSSMENRNENLMAGANVFGNTQRNRVPEDVQAGEAILREFGGNDYRSNQGASYGNITERAAGYGEMNSAGEYGLSVAENRYKQHGEKLHVVGTVAGVIDSSLLMVVFDKPIGFDDVEGVANFKFTLLVQSCAGRMENGKYKTGIVTIKGYGNCMIDDYTAIIETTDVELFSIKERIHNRNCNIILVRQ